MIDIFKKKHKSLIGVDISSTHIKMIELSGTQNNMCVENYAISSIPDGLYADHNILDIEKLADAVQSVWTKLGTTNKNVAIAMPAAMIISKRFEMPDNLTAKDQLAQVESEAASYIPFGLDEVNLDYQVLGPMPGREGVVEVYVAVSRKQHVDERLAVMQMAGLNPKVLDVDQMAVIHALAQMTDSFEDRLVDTNVLVVDIGSKTTEYQVLRNFEPIYNREHNFALSSLKQTILNNYGCSETEADSLIRNVPDMLDRYPDYNTNILQPFLDGMALEIIRHIQLYESSGIWEGISHIILCGSAATLEGLDDTIEQRTGMDTKIANTMLHCHLSNKIRPDLLLNDAPSLVVSFGLALRSFV